MVWFGHFLTALLWIGVALFSVCGLVLAGCTIACLDPYEEVRGRRAAGFFAGVVGCCILVALLVSIGVA